MLAVVPCSRGRTFTQRFHVEKNTLSKIEVEHNRAGRRQNLEISLTARSLAVHNRNIAPIAMSASEIQRKSEASQQGETKFRRAKAKRAAMVCGQSHRLAIVNGCRGSVTMPRRFRDNRPGASKVVNRPDLALKPIWPLAGLWHFSLRRRASAKRGPSPARGLSDERQPRCTPPRGSGSQNAGNLSARRCDPR